MKTIIGTAATLLMLSSSLFAQVDGPFSFSSGGKSQPQSTGPEGPAPVICDDLEMLQVGLLNGQFSELGQWFDIENLVPEVVLIDNDTQIRYTNQDADGEFDDIAQLDFDPTFHAVADDGFTLSIDYTISDANSQFYFTPQDIVDPHNFIFARFGDSNGNGTWDVLESDGMGNGVFVDTGVAIPLVGTVEFTILDLDMSISVNGKLVYTGGVIGVNGDISVDAPGELLSSLDIETLNTTASPGAQLTVNNIAINTTCSVCPDSVIGDVNLDGFITLLDVGPFVDALSAGGSMQCEADVNQDGSVDLLDVGPFVVLISGG